MGNLFQDRFKSESIEQNKYINTILLYFFSEVRGFFILNNNRKKDDNGNNQRMQRKIYLKNISNRVVENNTDTTITPHNEKNEVVDK